MAPDTVTTTRLIIQIKLAASSLIKHAQVLCKIKEWQADEEELMFRIYDISLSSERAITELEAVVNLTENFLTGPPSYEPNPNEQWQRMLELKLLCGRALERVREAHVRLMNLKDGAMEMEEGMSEMSLVEAMARVEDISSEAGKLLEYAEELEKAWGENDAGSS